MKAIAVMGLAVMGSVILLGLSIFAQSQSASSTHDAGVTYQVTTVVTAKALTPMPGPGPNAKQQSKQAMIGQGKAMVKTSKDNTTWVEEVDIDGSGRAVDTQMLWDDTDKVLYTYAEKSFQCADGSSGDGNFLIATYGKGNRPKKPAGSGWWLADLDKGECKARADQLFGCKFDASGKNTACGVATLNEKTHELTIIEATTTSNQ